MQSGSQIFCWAAGDKGNELHCTTDWRNGLRLTGSTYSVACMSLGDEVDDDNEVDDGR